jgi:hypothetical protein
MIITFDLIINPVIMLAAVIGGGIIGYMISKLKMAKSRAKIQELEKEMMSSHAEILDLQKAYVQLENKLEQQPIPVISMKINGKDNSKEKATK